MYGTSITTILAVLLVLVHWNGNAAELCLNPLLGFNHLAHLRLAGFNSSLVGYLELCRDGVWKSATINDGEWGRKEATVVCKELGYHDAITFSHIEGRELIQTANRLHFRSIRCKGTENSLSECASEEMVMRDDSLPTNLINQILVLCNQNPILGTIRLVGVNSESQEGMLEMYHPHPSYRWSTVCDNDWTDTDALVACKQMGFSSGKSKHYSFNNRARVLPRKRYDYFHCNGTEETLLQCEHHGPYPYKCNSDRYAGVVCEGHNSQGSLTTLSIGLIVLSGVLFVLFVVLAVILLIFMGKKMKQKWFISSPHGVETGNGFTSRVHPFQYSDISNFVPPPTYEETLSSGREEPQSESMTTVLITDATVSIDSMSAEEREVNTATGSEENGDNETESPSNRVD